MSRQARQPLRFLPEPKKYDKPKRLLLILAFEPELIEFDFEL
jgi:hypothetical protein